jgi:biotin transporter BioY
VPKILTITAVVLGLVAIAVLIGWKLGFLTFYIYKIKR